MKDLIDDKIENGIEINIKLSDLKKKLQMIEKRLGNTSGPFARYLKHKIQDLERKL